MTTTSREPSIPRTPAAAQARPGLPQGAVGLLAGLAATLTVLDGVATYVWLGRGHAEANPLIDRLIVALGAAPAMAVRITIGLGLLTALALLAKRARLAPYGLVVVTGVLLGVGLWHGAGAALALGG